MIQRPSGTIDALCDRISAALQRGGTLSPATLNYIDAALFPPDPARLTPFLRNDADSERDTLLDLIFYPDQALQMDLEPLLETARPGPGEARDLDRALAARSIHAPICMPDGRRLVHIRVPGFIKSRYLDRLHVTWRLDGGVAAAIHDHVAAARQVPIKVRLRNSGREFNAGQAAFLARVVARLPADAPDFDDCLDLALAILPPPAVRTDAWELLAAHKRDCFRSLQQARRFEALRQRSNMETLMLQGIRAPHASVEVMVRRMGLIDRICGHVFGRTEIIEAPLEGPLRVIDDPTDPDALIRSLLP